MISLPREIIFNNSLKKLHLFQTKIDGVPSEVLSEDENDNCLQRLRAHFRDLESGRHILCASKLVVLGNGRVGKTQVCRALQKLPYDESVPTTHGITITSIPWLDVARDERLNLWDFGGQDIYHGTHALFLKTRATFLLVWHPEFESGSGHESGGVAYQNQPLAYWLEYIRTLGQESQPILIVQSRCDRPEQEARNLPVDETYLEVPFLKICHFSAKQNRGKAALREAITEAIYYLRQNEGEPVIGKGRMKVLKQLEKWRAADQKRASAKRQHRTLAVTEFEALCDKTGGISSKESLLEYLHNTGTVFYRKELFDGKIILDQTWALEAVYSVFDREKSCRQIMNLSGRFTRSLLEMAVWSQYSEAEQRLFISLMESCDICFLHRKENQSLALENEYIAPDLLPDKTGVAHQLDGRWDEKLPAKRLEIEYPFLHPGLMRSLICDVGQRAGDAGVYWKYGVWVYERGTRALVEQVMVDAKRGKIVAQVQGERCGDLAIWLRDKITERSRLFGYPEIKPELDEFPKKEEIRWGKQIAESEPVSPKPETAAPEPKFEKMPVAQFPIQTQANVFVSYAWGDATPEGVRRQKLVDDLCSSLDAQGVKVLRDCNELRPGDRISEFMDRLVDGNYIICIISDKYLRSPNCMYELFSIYAKCGDKPGPFLKKVIPLILPDAKLKTLSDRLDYAGFWKTERDTIKREIDKHGIDVVGEEAIRKFHNIRDFSHNVSNVLELLVDKLMPRDFDRMANEGFKEVLDLIKG